MNLRLVLLIIEGAFAKIITGTDDMLTHTSLVALLAKTKKGKISFISGMFVSIIFLILLSMLFGSVLQSIPYKNLISAGLLVSLAFLIYFNKFVNVERDRYIRLLKKKVPAESRVIILFFMGVLVFFATGIDDIVVYSSLFANTLTNQLFIAVGIVLATVVELMVIFHFSRFFSKVKNIEKITIAGLIILAFLVGFSVI